MTEHMIPVTDPFERDFGHMSKDDKTRIVGVLQRFMISLRDLRDSEGSRRIIRLSRPEVATVCTTCAFTPSIDGRKEFPGTAYGLPLVILDSNKFFACHSNQSTWPDGSMDPEHIHLCRGYEALLLYNASKTVLLASQTLKEILGVEVKN